MTTTRLHKIKVLNLLPLSIWAVVMAAAAVFTEWLLGLLNAGVPAGLRDVSASIAETGFSVTVIAVSMLAVITNVSGKTVLRHQSGRDLKNIQNQAAAGILRYTGPDRSDGVLSIYCTGVSLLFYCRGFIYRDRHTADHSGPVGRADRFFVPGAGKRDPGVVFTGYSKCTFDCEHSRRIQKRI